MQKELDRVQSRVLLLNELLNNAKPGEKFVEGDAFDVGSIALSFPESSGADGVTAVPTANRAKVQAGAAEVAKMDKRGGREQAGSYGCVPSRRRLSRTLPSHLTTILAQTAFC